MLRALLALLLLANLLFFGWANAWFGPAFPAPGAGQREPARLAAQVAPERVTVLAPEAASAALAATERRAKCPPVALPPDVAGVASAASAALASASQAAGLNPCEPGP
jgi:hypothetical protein